jgi:glycosyltransferase involved in cell wall biosynthesis
MYQGLYGTSGGEDMMCLRWAELLQGECDLHLWTKDLRVKPLDAIEDISKKLNPIWNFDGLKELEGKLDSVRPELVIFGNFQGLSPAALHAVARRDIKAITLVHNYRPVCGSALLFRAGEVCTLCPTQHWSAAIRTRCIGGKLLNSTIPAVGTQLHKSARSYERSTMMVAPSQFVAKTLQEFGISHVPYTIMPNWAESPKQDYVPFESRQHFLFAGYLHEYKGVMALIHAWRSSRLHEQNKLFIAGHGPLRQTLDAISREDTSIVILGLEDQHRLRERMGTSLALIVPSSWHEAFGLVAIEAMSVGTPIITTDRGALPETNQGGVGEIVSQVTDIELDNAWTRIANDWNAYSQRALHRYRTQYSADAAKKNLQALLAKIFEQNSSTDSPKQSSER